MLSEPRTTRIKQLNGYHIKEEYIVNFEKEWNAARKRVIETMERYERLYRENKDFRNYVDSYMRNKTVSLSEVLSLKMTRMVADNYERQKGRC